MAVENMGLDKSSEALVAPNNCNIAECDWLVCEWLVEILFNDGSVKTGRLINVSNEDIMIEEKVGKGKKTETIQLLIPFSNIKTTTVQIEF